MIIGSHNAWSYLSPKKWWMKLIYFTAKCQSKTIREQYNEYNVRCFDLRLRMDLSGFPIIVHGAVEYNYPHYNIEHDLEFLNNKKDCYVRVILDTRSKQSYTVFQVQEFCKYCEYLENTYSNIKFWCGRNLYNWNLEFLFKNNPSCEEKYSSVCPPKIIDDWWPWLYARIHNSKNIAQGTKSDILLIDYVNIK